MNTKRFVAFSIALSIFLCSTLVAWYEGAQIYDTPWEWENTALFSSLIHEKSISSLNEISEIDHFIYSAKFQPLFPFLMVASLLTLALILFYPLFIRSTSAVVVGCLFLTIASFFIVYLLGNSPTPGFKLFTYLFGILGVSSSATLTYFLSRLKKKADFSRRKIDSV